MAQAIPPCARCQRPIPKGKEKMKVLDKPKLVSPPTSSAAAQWETIEYYHEECLPKAQ